MYIDRPVPFLRRSQGLLPVLRQAYNWLGRGSLRDNGFGKLYCPRIEPCLLFGWKSAKIVSPSSTAAPVISMMGAQGVEWKRHGRSVVIRSRETVSELRSPCLYQPEPEQLSGPRVRIR